MNKKSVQLAKKLSRQFTASVRAVPSTEEGGQVRYSLTLASETPYLRQGWVSESAWYEVLSHAPEAVDLSRADGFALLMDHNWSDQVGVFDELTVEDSKLQGLVRFSKSQRASEVEQDVADGIRKNVSVGYQVLEYTLAGTAEDGLPIYIATKWQPLEGSIVSVPADFTVGFNRSAAGDETVSVTVIVDSSPESEQEETAPAAEGTGTEAPVSNETDKADEAGEAAPDEADTEAAAAAARVEIDVEISRIFADAGFADQAAAFIAQKKSVDDAAKQVLALRRSVPTTSTKPIQQQKKDSPKMKYSIARAIQVALGVEKGGLEADLDAKIAASLPDKYQRHGKNSVFVPISAAQVRALSTDAAGAGQETVFTEQGEFIDLLRNKSTVIDLGARMYTNLRGPVAFPKLVGGAAAHWVSETPGADVNESQALFTSVTLSPKTLQATTALSRQLLTQSAIDIEAIVQDDLAKAHALAIDRAAFHGQGGVEPVGIYNAAGVTPVDFSAGATRGKLVDMVTEVAAANADFGAQAFVTTPRVAGQLAQTLEASAAGAGFIWTGKLSDGAVIGYTAKATNQIASNMGVGANEHGLVFGNFDDVMIGTWGILEIVVDEYTLKKQGLIEITTFQMADVALRHGASFAKATLLTL